MKYIASQIVERAKKLADIANTDYISHQEDVDYLNDAFKDLYQLIINKGDTQFVKEVELGGAYNSNDYTEYVMPWDLYQIKTIQDKFSGREILRKSTTESVNSGTYDVVNNKLRVYGYAGQNLVMTYYIVPPFLSFPDKTFNIDNYDIISVAVNSALVNNRDGTLSVINLLTKAVVSTFEWSNPTSGIVLGNGHFFYDNKWYDLNGDEIGSVDSLINVLHDDHWNVLVYGNYDGEYKVVNRNGRTILSYGDTEPEYAPRAIYKDIDISFDDTILYVKQQAMWDMEEPVAGIVSTSNMFNDCKVFYVATESGAGFKLYYALLSPKCEIVDVELIETEEQDALFALNYGVITNDGTFSYLRNWVPDTLLNFPNELYFSLMSADLASKYAMKANADTGALDNLYQKYYSQFMNSLSQAAGYTRIKNVYR